jgi:glyoxylase I family protein
VWAAIAAHTQPKPKFQEFMGIEIERYLHTAIAVSDLDQAIYFYGTILGLERVDRQLRFPGAWYQIGDEQIHLIVQEPATPEPCQPLDPQQKWGRNPHLAFRVQDLEQAKEQLLHHNCPIQMSASGRSALFTHDPDGNVIELGE